MSSKSTAQVYGRENAKTLLDPRGLAPGLVAALGVGALAADAGGYDPTSWGWSTVALLIVVGAALIVGGRRLAPLEWALPGALAALAALVWLSLAWSSDFSQTVLEGERILLYVAATSALLLLGRRSRVESLLASLAAAITAICAYALIVRMFQPGSGAYQVDASTRRPGSGSRGRSATQTRSRSSRRWGSCSRSGSPSAGGLPRSGHSPRRRS